MKTTLAIKKTAGMMGVILTLGGIALLTNHLSTASHAAESSKDEGAGFADHLNKWQEKMSDAFRDTLKGLRSAGTVTQVRGAVSADLREQNDSYTLRLSLPDRDLNKVEVSLKDSTLHVVAPEDGRLRRYEQSIVLSDVSPDAKPEVARHPDDKLIMVTVPKASSAGTDLHPHTGARSNDPALNLEHNTMEQMWQMRREMDRIFENSFKPFSLLPDFKGFFDESRFGSTYTVDESGNDYVVRVFLPDRDMNNVNVTIEGQIMKIEAKAEKSAGKSNGDNGVVNRMAEYTQLITLPSPVNATKMKVDNKEGLLVVTVPRAGSK
jgi:HSP20 family molecular chaperone IbpA